MSEEMTRYLDDPTRDSVLHLCDRDSGTPGLHEANYRQSVWLDIWSKHVFVQSYFIVVNFISRMVDERKAEGVARGVEDGVNALHDTAVIKLNSCGGDSLHIRLDADASRYYSVGKIIIDDRMTGKDAMIRLQAEGIVVHSFVGGSLHNLVDCSPWHDGHQEVAITGRHLEVDWKTSSSTSALDPGTSPCAHVNLISERYSMPMIY
jgi:hypothetical protein